MKKHQIFLYFSLCFILGVAIRSFFNNFDIFYGFIVLLAGIIFIIFNLHNKKLRIIFLGVVFLFLGILRFELSEPKINSNHIAFYNNSTIEFIGKVSSEPDVREKHIKLTIKTQKLVGKILVNAPKNIIYNYGDELKIKCWIEKPGVFETDDWQDFDYGKYLAIKNIYSVCYKPISVEKININRKFTPVLTQVYAKIFYAKPKFKNIIDTNLPLPESGLLNAMLLGYKTELSDELRDNFSKTGVSHLVAISGLHITTLAGILFFILMSFGIMRAKCFWPGITILFSYILLIGFRASAVRAFIMGAILFYALNIGRLKNGINALLLAASILLLINPKLLIYDIGFQLSFLAVFGILYFYPFFIQRLKIKSINNRFYDFIISIISLTLSAQVLTLPLVFYYFGVISFISPITNLLIIPILPFVLIGGIILILLNLIYAPLAFYFGFLVWLVLKYIILITEFLAQIKFGFLKF
ncbi:ComEC family competence protein [Candidatus Parcubacteria bacterium]|nr:ComEC family competence protein [Patescibacteria group bacterium]MCG2686664.1 ComEC family competence protein [Candidatus Parcubacteria bacterium]